MNNKATMFDGKRRYVESLNNTLSVLSDFEAIEYANDHIQGDEYIRIRDKLGQAFYINVTGGNEADILREVARMILEKRAAGFITDTNRKREIAPMFRKAV